MHYPWWYVPFLTSPMLIAIVSVLHIVVSHYAVGGGLFLAVETRFAYKNGNKAYLDYLRRHAWFFIMITVVYGAITGVGIWWTIGLASPLATETLIHKFVFAWAMEYVFFILEIVSAFVYFYLWDKLTPKTHQLAVNIYAFSAWMSLFIITGITGYMLNPGEAPASQSMWAGFFNPQLIPQVLSRTGGAFLLTTLYVFLHSSFSVKENNLRNMIEKRSAIPALWGSIFIVIGGIGWYLTLPESAKAALASASVLNVLMVLIFALTFVVFALMYFGPYKNPGWLSPGFAILFFCCGFAAITTGEYIREAVRKPYIIYNQVMGNQILADEIPGLRQIGYLEGGRWTYAWMKDRYPQVFDGETIDEKRILELPESDQINIGAMLFQYHCNDCHALNAGYSPVGHLIRGYPTEMIKIVVDNPELAAFFMPPFAGTPEEAEILTRFLSSLAPAHPEGMYYGNHN